MIALSSLERAVPLLDRLKTLDASIAALSDAAEVCANSRTAVKLRVDITDLDAKEAAESRVVINDNGDIVKSVGPDYGIGYSFAIPTYQAGSWADAIAATNSMLQGRMPSNAAKPTTTLEQSLSEYDTLHVIGVLLQIRRAERAEIMNALKELGCE